MIDFESFCRAVQRMIPRLRLSKDSQFDPVIRCVHQILLGAQVPLGRLHGRMAQQQLDLFQFAAGRAAQLGARPTTMPHAA